MKKILIVIDFQEDFINGSLGTKEAQQIVPNVIKKIQEYENNGNRIIFTKDTHFTNYLETQEGKFLKIKHCIIGTKGWDISEDVSEIINFSKYKIFAKDTFGSKRLAEHLYFTCVDFEEIEIIGLYTDICVISNALLIKAFLPEIKIAVDADCCAGTTPRNHMEALNIMRVCQINIV